MEGRGDAGTHLEPVQRIQTQQHRVLLDLIADGHLHTRHQSVEGGLDDGPLQVELDLRQACAGALQPRLQGAKPRRVVTDAHLPVAHRQRTARQRLLRQVEVRLGADPLLGQPLGALQSVVGDLQQRLLLLQGLAIALFAVSLALGLGLELSDRGLCLVQPGEEITLVEPNQELTFHHRVPVAHQDLGDPRLRGGRNLQQIRSLDPAIQRHLG